LNHAVQAHARAVISTHRDRYGTIPPYLPELLALVARIRSVPGRRTPRTLTFLFADIRDYTAFVEAHGDAAAHRLIADFRRMVRAQLALTRGGEIKTEGDSFYLVFEAASQALRCGTAILQEAEHRNISADRPLGVGLGIHAGEPVALDDQYVGSAVNLAARVGAAAGAGELLITDTVRGLLRTSGLPPLVEREGLLLKGIQEAPRVYSVDWRKTEFMSAGEDLPDRALLPPAGGRALLAGVLAAFTVALGIVGIVSTRTMGGAPPANNSVPPHGAQLFEADLTPAGGSRALVSVGSAQDHVRFTGEAIRFEVSAASWAAISVLNLSPDDFVTEFAVRPVDGNGSVALFFRGSAGRQDQVALMPSTGEVTIQVVKSFEVDAAPERLFGPASRVPASRDQETDLVVSAHGRDIVVFLSGAEIARSADPVLAGGSIGVVAYAARNQSLVIELRALRLYNQPGN
jgi:class 3 adenylate cyclase